MRAVVEYCLVVLREEAQVILWKAGNKRGVLYLPLNISMKPMTELEASIVIEKAPNDTRNVVVLTKNGRCG